MTLSIIARDNDAGQIGVAVQSHFFSVGADVGWAESGVGAVATQSFNEVSYGPRGLDLMRGGHSAQRALDELRSADTGAELRQVAMLATSGEPAVHTGSRCCESAGHLVGPDVSVQGNMLADESVLPAMLAAYEQSGGDLPERMLAALEAGEAAGGDIRGRQSSALLVVLPPLPGVPSCDRVAVDVRVDDDPDPLTELRRLTALSRWYRRFLDLVRTPGLFTGEFSASDEQTNDALTHLEEGVALLGDNDEAAFWRGVLLDRAGHHETSRNQFREVFTHHPALETFLARLRAAGLLGHSPTPHGPVREQ